MLYIGSRFVEFLYHLVRSEYIIIGVLMGNGTVLRRDFL